MTANRAIAIEMINEMPEEKLISACDFLRYLSGQPIPLDDYDYELARAADEDTDDTTVSMQEANKRRRTDLLSPITIDTRGWKFDKEEANER